ncbi:hypothetical protein HKK52_00435 [Pseudomonas sp. ADAK2]|uniref:hypothetical protein n=1 Tax=unclassified Pseudomonas TaxID=196821 RepID=UPI001463BBC5|nr:MULTISPECIES: hypothetical protein [unclassified Pseudomonas]QJI39456.1 hypothetical protein HKK53_00435 [Pseudomonas sp. ADAK7]QJI45762.1 hypothetical protein HKK52_00435 [Pseudomonas sp. ADAK2]
MTTKNEFNIPIVTLIPPLTLDWETDKATIKKAAMQPTPADKFYILAAAIQNFFNILTHGSKSAPKHPQRSGLLRKVYDELFPIAHFAKLYFAESNNVLIQWFDGNQNFDATVKYQNECLGRSDIRYLEVTTLQDREDARQLEELSEEKTITTVVESEQQNHLRKIDLFEKALKKKGGITYPADTALLVYTDEDRFRKCYFGLQPPEIDKKKDYEAVLNKLSHLLKDFSHVFVYSKHEIYCTWSPKSNQEE